MVGHLIFFFRCEETLTLSILGNIFSRRHFESFFFLFFPRKQDLIIHAKSFQLRQFAWNVKSCFSGKISPVCRLLISPESGKGLIIHAKSFQFRQFAWNVKSCFPGKISSVCRLLISPESGDICATCNIPNITLFN